MPTLNIYQFQKDIWDIVTDGIQRKVIRVGDFTSLLDLKDTPTTFVGKAGYTLKVNADEDGVEFVL